MNQPLKSFTRGGVHPHDNKELTRVLPIQNAPLPSLACIPLHQHMGKAADCLVAVGDTIEEGMLIGKSSGMFSANIHASVPGKVTEIKEIYLPNGIKSQAVVINLEGEFNRSGKSGGKLDWAGFSAQQLVDKITQHGIVGLGGATFPTHIKYLVPAGKKAAVFVVNGVECEPFLSGDHRLMLEKTAEIIEGIQIIQKILNPSRTVIGIEANKPDAIEALEKSIAQSQLGIEVVPLKVRYPQGDEKQLLKALIGREVPSQGLPIDIGAVVSNIGTVFAIYEAVVIDKPLFERVVTVSGSMVRKPANLKIRIGTSIRTVLEDCGGLKEGVGKIICGGPMMGFALADIDSPVTKGTSGILAFSQREARPGQVTNCLQCGRCVRACPFGLSPTRLYRLIDHAQYDEVQAEGLADCKECGCCSFSCPAHIPLVQQIKLGKLITRNLKAKLKK